MKKITFITLVILLMGNMGFGQTLLEEKDVKKNSRFERELYGYSF